MTNSGLIPILKSAFSGVEKMLIGKKFPMNMRAWRLVVIELLRGYINDIRSYKELLCFLDTLSSHSILAEHWINNLIKPVLIMMLCDVMFEQNEKETFRCINTLVNK